MKRELKNKVAWKLNQFKQNQVCIKPIRKEIIVNSKIQYYIQIVFYILNKK